MCKHFDRNKKRINNSDNHGNNNNNRHIGLLLSAQRKMGKMCKKEEKNKTCWQRKQNDG